MLFHSYLFTFLFLLPLLMVFWRLEKKESILSLLIFASIVFYAFWNTTHLIILLTSITLNYLFAKEILFTQNKNLKRVLLFSVLLLNLAPLIYFKYSYFLHLVDTPLILPLAISFFTFQQIAFQVDIYYNKVTLHSFKEYLFFVLFFPQLVAGPIVHYNDIMPQISPARWQKKSLEYLWGGIFLFSVGLFKKVIIADSFTPYANRAFEQTESINSADAWLGLLAYSFEIYFDFSAYSDMAIGLGLMFGIFLPLNFNSPYKSRNLIHFWRRWNITLSRFLRDYVYIPLGGNRVRLYRQALNLLLTMTIGGIWHGAGWSFLLWGVFHGAFLALLHLTPLRLPRLLAVFTTFATVTLLWVFFRSPTIEGSLLYYQKLFEMQGAMMPSIASFSSLGLFLFAAIVVWFTKNAAEHINYNEASQKVHVKKWHLFFAGVLFFVAMKSLATSPAQNFVYFNF